VARTLRFRSQREIYLRTASQSRHNARNEYSQVTMHDFKRNELFILLLRRASTSSESRKLVLASMKKSDTCDTILSREAATAGKRPVCTDGIFGGQICMRNPQYRCEKDPEASSVIWNQMKNGRRTSSLTIGCARWQVANSTHSLRVFDSYRECMNVAYHSQYR